MDDNSRKKLEDRELNLDLKFDFNNEDNKSKKDVLSKIPSVIALLTALFTGFTMLTNRMFALHAEKFYKVPEALFYYNRNFDFVARLVIYMLTAFVLLRPLKLRSMWENNYIDILEVILRSALISLYIVILFTIIFFDQIVQIFINVSSTFIYFVILFGHVVIRLFFIFLITGKVKLWDKEANGLGIINNVRRELRIDKWTMSQKLFFIIYILFLLAVMSSLRSVLTGPSLDPKDKMSYEILKDEEVYNVIIGYKDGMAISLTGEESISGGKTSLNFISNEYVLQDVKDKVRVYKTYDKVNAYRFPRPISGSNGSIIDVSK